MSHTPVPISWTEPASMPAEDRVESTLARRGGATGTSTASLPSPFTSAASRLAAVATSFSS